MALTARRSIWTEIEHDVPTWRSPSSCINICVTVIKMFDLMDEQTMAASVFNMFCEENRAHIARLAPEVCILSLIEFLLHTFPTAQRNGRCDAVTFSIPLARAA